MNCKQIRDYGIKIGSLPTGRLNKITDVPGVKVGHYTLCDERHRTGVTVILPHEGNLFTNKVTAAAHVINGFGKTCGTVQLDELGSLETPIALTSTLNVGKVADGLVGLTLARCREDGVECTSVNAVVGENNDASMSDVSDRIIGEAEVFAAVEAACEDFDEGDVGAGKGTFCYGLKGGIGSASRVFTLGGGKYTLGALVQTNFGATADLMIAGMPVGEYIVSEMRRRSEDIKPAAIDRGSVMIVIGCDLPLSEIQLRRVFRRAVIGLARTGSYVGHGSGDIVLGFTTFPRNLDNSGKGDEHNEYRVTGALDDRYIETVFRAAAESVEEAVLNSMTAADRVVGYSGKVLCSLNEFLPGYLALNRKE